jgi:transposase-like protein
LVCNGRSAKGKQRWLCKECGRSTLIASIEARRKRQRIWFEHWVREGYSIRQLSQQSGYNESTLRRIVNYWLEREPEDECDLSGHKHIIVDGTFIQGRSASLVMFQDGVNHEIISGAYGIKEGGSDMFAYCRYLKSLQLSPESATIDGNPQVFAMLRTIWPEIIIQRCLIHIQRQGLSWCRRHPSRTDAQHLRRIFLQVAGITTTADRDAFLSAWDKWENRYGKKIAVEPGKGWVFSDLKRARSMLHKALPNMFHYLQNGSIPNSTNSLESYFSRLKMRYRQHRGLNPKKRKNYFKWFFFLCKK